MTRFHDWPERLHAAIEAARARPFAWGAHDCALFACDVVRAMTGEDPGREFRGCYGTAAGALRALRRRDAGDLECAAARLCGDEVAPALARRGDVVSMPVPSGPALGICIGPRVALVGPDGLIFPSLADGRRAWRI